MRFSLFACSSLLIHKQQLWLGEKYKMKQRATVEIVKTKFQCAFLRWSFFVAGFFFSLSTDVVYVFDCSFGIHDLLQSFSFVSFRIHNEKLLSCFPPLSALFCTFEQMVNTSDASSLSVFRNAFISISVLSQKYTFIEKAQFHRKAYELP